MEARAIARFVRVTPQKARRVVDLIRGMEAAEAQTLLKFAPQAASEPIGKVLDSAIDLMEHPEFAFGSATPAVAEALAVELDADCDVALAVRWGALLHDIAKPQTRHVFEDGQIGRAHV